MDPSNVVSFIEAKRKQLEAEGKLKPLLLAFAVVVVGLIILMVTKSDKVSAAGSNDKPVNVVVNLNERKKMARRDPKDVTVSETPAPEPKKNKKPKKDKPVETQDDKEPEVKKDEEKPDDAEQSNKDEE